VSQGSYLEDLKAKASKNLQRSTMSVFVQAVFDLENSQMREFRRKNDFELGSS